MNTAQMTDDEFTAWITAWRRRIDDAFARLWAILDGAGV